MLEDLLTIRADRQNYYYGADQIFQRRLDTLTRFHTSTPTLLLKLMDIVIRR